MTKIICKVDVRAGGSKSGWGRQIGDPLEIAVTKYVVDRETEKTFMGIMLIDGSKSRNLKRFPIADENKIKVNEFTSFHEFTFFTTDHWKIQELTKQGLVEALTRVQNHLEYFARQSVALAQAQADLHEGVEIKWVD